jgi:hypothetical protein
MNVSSNSEDAGSTFLRNVGTKLTGTQKAITQAKPVAEAQNVCDSKNDSHVD